MARIRTASRCARAERPVVKDLQPDEILPPSSKMKRANTVPNRAAGNVIDIDFFSEAFPRAKSNRDWIDFSVVFGDESETVDFPGGPPDPLQQPEKAKKRTAKDEKAPEQRITIFAFRMAMIEKAASMLGTVAFLWATVVLLGGFASSISIIDFVVVTAIIVAEGSRIFSRSHELEWQRLSSKSTETLGSRLRHSFKGLSCTATETLGSRLQNSFEKANADVTNMLKRIVKPPIVRELDSDMHSSSVTVETNLLPSEPLSPSSRAPQKRTWSKLTLPVLPYLGQSVTAEDISTVLYVLELMSAIVSIGLSVWRLSQTPAEGSTRVSLSLYLFYALSVAEAGLFLVEKCYLEYKCRYAKFLDKVIAEAELGEENLDMVQQFYYDVYAECLTRSVFDGLEMDFVLYSISWLEGDDFCRQLSGARLLNVLVADGNNSRSATDVLRRVGTTPGIIERLVEMLSWDSRHEKVLLSEIATIVCRLVAFNRNCSRIVAIPGSMDGVVSLLMTYNDYTPQGPKTYASKNTRGCKPPLQLWLAGLSILKHLSKDPKNSLKIGETPRLLAILVTFIEVRDEFAFDASKYSSPSHFKNRKKTYKKSLQVLGSLAAATNSSGKILRQRIAGVVSGLKNLRDMMQYGHNYPELQRLALEIISNLAMESDVREIIGATGGVLRNLFEIFVKYDSVRESQSLVGLVKPSKEKKVREERRMAAASAGLALNRLALQADKNCTKLLRLRHASSHETFIKVMINTLSETDDSISSSAARILRSVMTVADENVRSEVARGSTAVVVDKIMTRVGTSKSEMYQACLGLASRTLGALDASMYTEILSKVDRLEFVKQLMTNLKHTPTTSKFPRIRRYSVELILAFITKDDSFLDVFQRINLHLREMLERTLDSISEVENFCLFSGLSGYIRHGTEMEDLVLRAIRGVDSYNIGGQQLKFWSNNFCFLSELADNI